MHALLPEPQTFSNSCMPGSPSLRLSQIHARPAATGAKNYFPHKEFIKKSMGRRGQEKKQQKCSLNALSQPPHPTKCYFTGSPPPKIHFHSLPAPKNALLPCCQSLRLSQIHACPAARAGGPRRTGAKFVFHERNLSRNQWAAAARKKGNKNALSQPPPPKILFHSLPAPNALSQPPRPEKCSFSLPAPKNALSQSPRPKKCSFTASPPPKMPFHSPKKTQSLRLSQFHACPAARA